MVKSIPLFLLVIFSFKAIAQPQDSTITEQEEDFSMYDNLDYVDQGAKRFCTSKVIGLSPQKLISIGYDVQGQTDISSSSVGMLNQQTEFSNVRFSHGLRLQGNIPVLSRNNIIIQVIFNYLEQRYNYDQTSLPILTYPFRRTILQNGIRSAGLGTTIFKPLNEKSFLLFQATGDNNGDYGWDNLPDLVNTRLSVAAIWGKKVSDRKMWGFGVSRTYRAGDLNYIPVFLLNWTAANGKWGAEMLLPARGNVRRTFNSRNILLLGYELEGQTYRIDSRNAFSALPGYNNLELRRSELRVKATYEFSLSGFIWLSFQAGFRYNYSFNVDTLPNNNDFFRGFTGTQPYLFEGKLSNTFYSLVSLNLVSP